MQLKLTRKAAALALCVATLASSALAGDVIEFQKLLAGDGATPDHFGVSVDSHNGLLIIGAKYADFDFIIDTGAAYIWKRVGPTSWEEEAKLNAPDAADGDVFGISSALGDNFALIGAYHHDIKAGNDRGGAAYFFNRAMDGTWSFHQKLIAPGAFGGETFGSSVAIDGDTAIIGAAAFNIPGRAGAAHIYRRDMAGVWNLEQSLLPSDSFAADQFGWSVDIHGNTAVVGAHQNDSGQGAIYVYTRDAMTGLWDAGVKVTPNLRLASERFGWAVSVWDDAILVGATQEFATSETGAAYIFRSDGLGGWTQEARLVGAEAVARNQIGRAVELRGDNAMVGAIELGMFPFPGDPGSVYVFNRNGGAWTQTNRIQASDGQGDDQFGGAIAIDDDLLIVGARTDDDFGFAAGASYVFDTHAAFCPADLNNDFVIDTADLGLLLAGFGGINPDLDINGDGVVDTADLGLLLSAFGSICD